MPSLRLILCLLTCACLYLLAGCTAAPTTVVDAPDTPGLSGLPGLPPLSSASSPRQVSDTDQDRAGDQVHSSSADATLGGGTALLAPPDGRLGWVIQEFDVVPGDTVKQLAWTITGLDPGEKVYLAVSDYETGTWHFLPPQTAGEGSVTLNATAGRYSNGTQMYVAVLAWDASFTLQLTRVTLASGGFAWQHHWGSPGQDGASRVVVDSAGNIIFAGTYDAFDVTASDLQRIGLTKMQPDGTRIASLTFADLTPDMDTESCRFWDMLLGADDAVYLVGSINSDMQQDGLVIKLDDTLTIVWAYRYGLPDSSEEFLGAAMDADGNLVCVGETSASDDLGDGGDAMVARVHGGTGAVLTATYYRIDEDRTERFHSVDIDADNSRLLLAGSGQKDFDDFDMYIASTGPDGAIDWATYYGGPEYDVAMDVVRGAGSDVHACGVVNSATVSTWITLDFTGTVVSEQSYSDELGATGIYIRGFKYNEQFDLIELLGHRMGVPEFSTSIVVLQPDLAVLSAADYGWWFEDYAFPGALYTAGLQTDDDAGVPTQVIHGGSVDPLVLTQTQTSASPLVVPLSITAADTGVAAYDTPDRYDGVIGETGDFDHQYTRFDPAA